MRIFLTDNGVAHGLLPKADWSGDRVSGYQPNAQGILVPADGICEGVSCDISGPVCEPVLSYFNSLSSKPEPIPAVKGRATGFCTLDGGATGFSPRARQVEALVAADMARIFCQPTPLNTPVSRAGLLMRARSALRAQQTQAPVSLRRGFQADGVQDETRSLPYARYFDVEDITIRHPRFKGGLSAPIDRAVFRAADAVTVLPYDPLLDQVVLVEQFRPGAYVRGDPCPWVLEPVAGRCDGDEPVEAVARREMIEEAGLTLLGLEEIAQYYPSPGCLSEYLYSFVGLVDLSDIQSGVFGVATEDEDILTHILGFDQAMALVQSGEADNGPLLLSLFWLGANRARLRAAASIA